MGSSKRKGAAAPTKAAARSQPSAVTRKATPVPPKSKSAAPIKEGGAPRAQTPAKPVLRRPADGVPAEAARTPSGGAAVPLVRTPPALPVPIASFTF